MAALLSFLVDDVGARPLRVGWRLLLLAALAAIVTLATPLGASAARPLATEDAPVSALGDCVVDAYVGHWKIPGEPAVRSTVAQFACGTGWRTQLGAGHVSASDGDRTRLVSVGGKSLLLGGDADAPSLAIAYGRLTQTHGPADRDDGSAYVTLAVSWPFATDWAFHGNLGRSRNLGDRRHSGVWSLAVERTFAGDTRVSLEAFGSDRERCQWAQLGLSQPLTPNWAITTSVGTRPSSTRALALTAGLTASF